MPHFVLTDPESRAREPACERRGAPRLADLSGKTPPLMLLVTPVLLLPSCGKVRKKKGQLEMKPNITAISKSI